MGKASITIAVGAIWNGQSAITAAQSSVSSLADRVSQLSSSTTSALANSGKQWQDYGSKISSIGQSMTDLGTTLTKAITVPMSALGSYCVSQAVTFDTALSDLNKTADLTSEQLEEFGNAALEASKTSPVTASETLEAEALGAQLGITTDNLESFATVANGLDIATSMDMETAATQMAQFANITGMSQSELSNYGSTIVDLGNHLATTEGDISSMALRLAGMTTSANFSSAEILGLAGAMSSLGINAEAGGSAMTQIVATITQEVANSSDMVEKYAEVAGMSAEEFASAWQNEPITALEAIVDGISNLSDQGQAADVTLSELGITSIRQSDVMRRLAGNTDVMHEALDRANTAWSENTALSTEVEKRNESLESRFETLKNKVNACAIEIGTPLANALLDVIDDISPLTSGIADMCEAFANADTDTQNFILGIAGIATAAGPVLTVLGSVVKVIGNATTAFGKVQSSVANFGNALSTTDGAAIRVYSSTDTLATKLGTLNNSTVKAAGGAKNYVSAWENMNDAAKQVATAQDKIITINEKLSTASEKSATKLKAQRDALEKQSEAASKSYENNAKLVSAWSGSTKEAENAVKAAESATKAYQSEGASCSKLQTSLSNVSSSYATMTTSETQAAMQAENVGTAVQAGATKAEVAIAGVKTALAGIGIGVAVAAIGELVTAISSAVEHANLYKEATASVSDIVSSSASSSKSAAESISLLGESYSGTKVDIDDALQSLADLNSSLGSVTSEVSGNSAKLDSYVATIERLAGKTNLTTSEQWQLKNAVEGYNSVCGTSYTVTDELNGVLSDSAGNALELGDNTEENTQKIQENTESLKQNAEAWKTQATAAAYSQKAAEYLEEYADKQLQVKQKTEELSWAKEKLAEAQEKVSNGDAAAYTELVKYQSQVDSCEKELSELQKAETTAADGAEYLQSMANLAATGLETGLIDKLANIETKMPGVGQNIAQSLANGINAGSLSVDTATQFLNSSVVTSLENMSGETAVYGQLLAERLAGGISSGSVSVEQATAAMSTYAQTGITGLAEYYQQQGWELPQDLANGLSSNLQVVTDGSTAVKDELKNSLADEQLSVDANAFGADTAAALASGLTSGQADVAAASTGLNDSSLSGLTSLESTMGDTGTSSGSALASGLNGETGSVSGASSNLYGAATSSTAATASTMGNQGARGGSSFAGALEGCSGDAAGASASLESSATSATANASGELGEQGSSGGHSFAEYLAACTGEADSSGASLANAASSGASSWDASSSGSHLGSQFASGIQSAYSAVVSAATSIANAAKSIIGFSVPDDGPWSGLEKGGVTSGRHLAENFAAGMRKGIPTIKTSAAMLGSAMAPTLPGMGTGYVSSARAYGMGATTARTVNNTYTLSIGGVEMNNLSQTGVGYLSALLNEVGITTSMGV